MTLAHDCRSRGKRSSGNRYGGEASLWYQPTGSRVMGGLDAGLTPQTFYAEGQTALATSKRGPLLGLGAGLVRTREATRRCA